MNFYSTYEAQKTYETKDGSSIRELMHPHLHGNSGQSLAEAVVQPGKSTILHRHMASEEIYHVTSGEGIMTRGEETILLRKGVTVGIPSYCPHRLENRGDGPLVVLCLCAPPYSHEDTELLEDLPLK